MLLDPFKEEFHLPAFPVEFRDRQRIKYGIIGNEPVNHTGGIVLICNHPERLRIMFTRIIPSKLDHLVTYHTGFYINRAGAFNSILHIIFCPGNEESPVSMNKFIQAGEIQLSLVNYVYGSWLNIKVIKDFNIMDGSLCKSHENREVAFEVQQSMHFDTSFVFPERSPWAKLQAQADRAAVKGIDKVVDVKPEVIIVLIHWPGYVHKDLGKVSIYPPVSVFIGFSKGVSWNSMFYSAMVQFIGNGFQTVLNITKAITLGKLGKAHDIEMIPAREIANTEVSFVSGNTFIELVFWHHGHKLSKDSFPVIHGDNRYDLAINVDFKSLKTLPLVTYLLLTYYITLSRT